MRAVDTNVLVRLITRDDEAQYRKAVAVGLIWVSHVVLMETVWVLLSAYRLEPEGIFGVLDGILKQENVVIEKPLVVQAALRKWFGDLNLDFTDLLILEIAREANRLPLATFDKVLGRQEGAEKL